MLAQQPRRKPAPRQVTLQNAVDLLVPHLCLDHQTTSSPGRSRLVTTPKTLYQPLLGAGNGSSNCPSIPSRGCSVNRSLTAMNRYSGLFLECPIQLGRSSPLPTADPCPPGAPPPSGTAAAVTSDPRRRVSNRSSLPSAQYRSNSRWYPASDLSITFAGGPGFNQHTQLLIQVRCRPETPNARSSSAK